MIIGIGTDIIEIRRIEQAVSRNHFVTKFFTPKEIELFKKKNNLHSIAGNFAAKEAVSKALGTGFRDFSPIDIEVLRDKKGEPYINLYKNAKMLAEKRNINNIYISISHCIEYATAYAVAERKLDDEAGNRKTDEGY